MGITELVIMINVSAVEYIISLGRTIDAQKGHKCTDGESHGTVKSRYKRFFEQGNLDIRDGTKYLLNKGHPLYRDCLFTFENSEFYLFGHQI
jgi:hypothetical protein